MRSILMKALLALAFFAVMGCGKERETYKPPERQLSHWKWAEDQVSSYSSPLPRRPPRPRVWLPETSAQAAFVAVALGLTLAGGIGVYRRRRFALSGGALCAGLIGLVGIALQPSGIHLHPLPHADWLWGILAFGFWFVARLTPIRLDDRTQKAWMVGMLFAMLVLRGLFGGMSPASVSWWLLAVVWELALAEAILEGLRDQQGLRIGLTALGWYLLCVLA